MFRENVAYLQKSLLGLFNSMPKSMQKEANESEEHSFYELIFCNIDESRFSVLYSDNASRPNAAVNCMVAALILQNRRNWTYVELFNNLRFNILTRLAFGLDNIEAMPFCPATLFNFQNRLLNHQLKTGEDLVEQVFDKLTDEQLKKLGLKTSIQRTDSFLVDSNIRDYTRIQILVETIIRFYRVLSEQEKKQFIDRFSDYIKGTSGQFIYRLKKSELPHELEKLAQFYHWVVKKFRSQYKNKVIYQILERVYHEHFTVAHKKVKVKPAEELSSSSLQSPDDPEATFRQKRKRKSKGRSINVVETAHPENPINLVTDVSVHQNNTDDSKALHGRCDILKKKTPDLSELHTDGGYGSSENDGKFESLGITQVQTAIKGRKSEVRFTIQHKGKDLYAVECPQQQCQSERARTRFKACFDKTICAVCQHREHCPAIEQKHSRVFYFNHDDYLRSKRFQIVQKIPKERRTLRNNVEATVKEFTCKTKNGKLRVRGTFKTKMYAFTTAISINFGRIYRYNLQTS